MKRQILAAVVFAVVFTGAVAAQDTLAILPFTGGAGEEGETIAELFSFSRELKATFTLIPRTTITRAIRDEQNFQAHTGMTDPKTVAEIGKHLGAKYVVAGSITKLGNNNLLIISIIKIDVLRQIAGDVQTYTKIGEIQDKLPDMARNIVDAAKINAAKLDKLAVIPVELGRNVDSRAADALAQILSINLIRSGKYAVYPRTATLEQVKEEYKNQRGGETAEENITDIGKGENPEFVLSVVARSLGDRNMFNASIISLKSGAQAAGGFKNYNSLNDGIGIMESLARELINVNTPDGLSLVQSLAWIKTNAVERGVYTITLKSNESIAPQTLSYNGKNVNITLEGETAERRVSLNANGSLFTVESGVTLTLGANVTLQGRSSNNAPLVLVNEGTLVLKDRAKISGNTAKYGGGVYVSSGTFTMSGGEISGNKASFGGGVLVSDGTFTMEGGIISGNKVDADNFGGGVYIMGGTFTMGGGEISGNTAKYGGGVSVSSGTFTMSGGEISGNSASYGGGVYVDGTFTMSGGTISGNSASGSGNYGVGAGGGVYSGSGTFTMSGGTISGNRASGDYSYGGGVDVSGGTFTMSGGTISGNIASNLGGGVSVRSNGTFIKQAGGTIYGSNVSGSLANMARSNGHAVYVDSGSKKRNTTAGAGVTLDSRRDGFAGGWE